MDDKVYQLILGCKGYVSKPDITATDELFLVGGSRNMLITDQGKVQGRAGTELFGLAATVEIAPKSSFKWNTSFGDEILLRETNGTLEYFSNISLAWEAVLTGLSATRKVRFAPIWNATELIDILLFVNHSAVLYEWSGAETTFASATTNTITKEGATTFAEERFLTAGTRSVRMKDTLGVWHDFVYTGGHGSTTLTGVTPDPTAFTFAAGALITQVVRTNANQPASGIVNDTIGVLENQVYLGSETSRKVYVSKNTSYIDYSFSTPRLPAEGASLTLDDVTTGFMADDESMYIFSGKSKIYFTDFILQSGSAADREIAKVKPIEVAANQGAISQELILRIKGAIVFINNNNELVELAMSQSGQRKLNQLPISDVIAPDFKASDFTDGMLYFFESSIFCSAPADSLTYIFDTTRKAWQPPQGFAIGLFSDFAGRLLGHSSVVQETYTLFEGTRDNVDPLVEDSGNAPGFKAYFAYRNGGVRSAFKNFARYFHELYMTVNAEVTHTLLYEYGGAKGSESTLLAGTQTQFLVTPLENASLGVNSLGVNPFGATLDEPVIMPKYRRIKPHTPKDFFEFQSQYTCDTIDANFQILAHGPAMLLSKGLPANITQ